MKRFTTYLMIFIISLAFLSCSQESKEVIYQLPIGTNIKECSPIFSRNTEHFAFVEEEAEGEAVVYDGEKGKTYPSVDFISLSPTGEHIAYLAINGKEETVVKDGKEIAKYDYKTVVRRSDNTKTLQLLEDGSLIYTKKEPKKMKKVIKNRKPVNNAPYSSKPEVSKDGKHLLYWVVNGTGDFLLFDEKKHKIDGLPLFLDISGDGKHYGAIVNTGKNKSEVIIDGVKKITFDSKNPVINFYLSETAKHYIFLQKDLATNKIKIKFDGEVVSEVEKVFEKSIAFSMDDLHYGLAMLKPNVRRANIFLDGKEIPSYDPNFSNINECFKDGRKLLFSPSGKHLLYVAGTGTNQILVIDKKILLRLDLYNNVIYNLFFSSENQAGCIFLEKVKKQLVKISKNIP